MATITPTRFGLKYAPIPTLALEYEEDRGVVEDESGTRSLYVVKETANTTKHVRKKLHVVELPHLTGHSEAHTIARQLQKDDHRFLGPTVVKEQQLKRLLQQLVDQLRGRGGFTQTKDHTEDAEEDEDDGDDDLGRSAMDESIAEASASMDVSKADEESRDDGEHHEETSGSKPRGKFIPQEDDDEDEAETSTRDRDDEHNEAPPTRAAPSEEDRLEAEDDDKKKKALKSDSDGSDNEEEDVQSEELEYFSEDGSDEDSF